MSHVHVRYLWEITWDEKSISDKVFIVFYIYISQSHVIFFSIYKKIAKCDICHIWLLSLLLFFGLYILFFAWDCEKILKRYLSYCHYWENHLTKNLTFCVRAREISCETLIINDLLSPALFKNFRIFKQKQGGVCGFGFVISFFLYIHWKRACEFSKQHDKKLFIFF